MEDQTEHPTREELEAFLERCEEIDGLVLEHPTPVRWYSLHEGRIVSETCNDRIAVWVLPDDVVTRDELEAGAVAAWEWSDRLYLAGKDATREDASGDYFVDVATNDAAFAEEFARVVGGKVRTREQMLHDVEHPGLADALAAWERVDDSVYGKIRTAHARRDGEFVADRRAKLRWGMLPPPGA